MVLNLPELSVNKDLQMYLNAYLLLEKPDLGETFPLELGFESHSPTILVQTPPLHFLPLLIFRVNLSVFSCAGAFETGFDQQLHFIRKAPRFLFRTKFASEETACKLGTQSVSAKRNRGFPTIQPCSRLTGTSCNF